MAPIRPGCRVHCHTLGASQRSPPAPAQQQWSQLQVRGEQMYVGSLLQAAWHSNCAATARSMRKG